jgi:hypothetical protein
MMYRQTAHNKSLKRAWPTKNRSGGCAPLCDFPQQRGKTCPQNRFAGIVERAGI